MTVDIIGGGGRELACRDVLCSGEGCGVIRHAVILPIPSTRNGREVTGTDTPLGSITAALGAGSVLAGWGIPETLRAAAEERGAVTVDVKDDGLFVEENAKLTAECTLSYIMSTEERSLGELRVGIVGYGRIGRELLELLLFHGARVTVFTRKESARLELLFTGVDAELVPDAELGDLDILVNTAPALLFSRKQCEGLECRVLELAPGDNYPWAKNLTRLPSLPAKMLPKSSGRLYAEAIVRALGKRGECK